LITSNPKKNWIYHTFYKPSKEKTLPKDHAFIKALVQDNKYIESRYIENLHSLKDQTKKERLLFGNWEYDDDPAKLMEYDAITDLFTNQANGQGNYLTADIARFGRDKTVLMAWEGYRVVDVESYAETSITDSAKLIEGMSRRHNIPRSRIVVDEDGLGGGVKDILRCKGFVSNSTPQKVKGEKENYQNLKAQCYFRLADRVNQRSIAVECNTETRELITEELEIIKQKDPDKDNKVNVIGKDKMKDLLGRSPDYADTLMMRMFFDVKKNRIAVSI
jgi:phage terminase large subunit